MPRTFADLLPMMTDPAVPEGMQGKCETLNPTP